MTSPSLLESQRETSNSQKIRDVFSRQESEVDPIDDLLGILGQGHIAHSRVSRRKTNDVLEGDLLRGYRSDRGDFVDSLFGHRFANNGDLTVFRDGDGQIAEQRIAGDGENGAFGVEIAAVGNRIGIGSAKDKAVQVYADGQRAVFIGVYRRADGSGRTEGNVMPLTAPASQICLESLEDGIFRRRRWHFHYRLRRSRGRRFRRLISATRPEQQSHKQNQDGYVLSHLLLLWLIDVQDSILTAQMRLDDNVSKKLTYIIEIFFVCKSIKLSFLVMATGDFLNLGLDAFGREFFEGQVQ